MGWFTWGVLVLAVVAMAISTADVDWKKENMWITPDITQKVISSLFRQLEQWSLKAAEWAWAWGGRIRLLF